MKADVNATNQKKNNPQSSSPYGPIAKKAMSEDTELAQACLALSNAGKILADLLEASGSGSRTDVAMARLEHQGPEDVVLICDIKLVSKQGTIASISSENTLPGALEPHMLSASHGNFCNMLDAAITNPLVSGFQAFLAKKVRASKSEKDLMESLSSDQDFTGLLGDD